MCIRDSFLIFTLLSSSLALFHQFNDLEKISNSEVVAEENSPNAENGKSENPEKPSEKSTKQEDSAVQKIELAETDLVEFEFEISPVSSSPTSHYLILIIALVLNVTLLIMNIAALISVFGENYTSFATKFVIYIFYFCTLFSLIYLVGFFIFCLICKFVFGQDLMLILAMILLPVVLLQILYFYFYQIAFNCLKNEDSLVKGENGEDASEKVNVPLEKSQEANA